MLSSRERIFVASLALSGVLLFSFFMVRKEARAARKIHRLSERMVFTRNYFYDPGVRPELLIDGDPSTAYVEKVPPGFPKKERSLPPTALPGPESLYIQMELGRSHFPGNPPRPNPTTELLLWPGYQGSKEEFQAFARPKKIRILFFRQQLVDVDREVRLPELPVYMGEKELLLNDGPGPVSIPLNFLEPPLPSPGFPVHVYQTWVRIEILSIYPGRVHPRTLAVSEIDYRQKIRAHTRVEVRQSPWVSR